MKQIITSLLLVAISATTWAQKVVVQYTEASTGVKKKINQTKKIIEEGEIIETVKTFNLPTKFEEHFIGDFKKNYSTGDDYIFSKVLKDDTYTIKISPNENETIKQHSIFLGTPPYDAHYIKDKPFLGIGFKPFDYKNAKNVTHLRGIEVTEVKEGEAAYNAGLEVGDVITAINGEKTPSISIFKNVIQQLTPKQETTFEYYRNGQKHTAKAIVGVKQSNDFDDVMMHFPNFSQENFLEEIQTQFNTIDFDALINELSPSIEQLQEKLGPKIQTLSNELEPAMEQLSEDMKHHLEDVIPELEKLTKEFEKELKKAERKRKRQERKNK